MYYLNIFLLFSFLGRIFESLFLYFAADGLVSGIMFGPFTPIFGIGAAISIFVYEKIKFSKNIYLNIGFYFVFLTVLFTGIEFIAGEIIEVFLGKEMWNYSDAYFSFSKYACFEISIAWSLMAFVLVCYIKPYTDIIIKKIPKKLSWLLVIYVIVDLLMVFFYKTVS